MTLRKFSRFLLISVLVGVLVGLFVGNLDKKTHINQNADVPQKADTQKKVAALVACLTNNTCRIPRTVESVNGVEVIGVYLKMTGINFKYMLQDKSTLGVVVVQDNNNQVTLCDEFQKGVVTKFFSLNNGVMKFSDVTDSKHGDQAREAQEWYDLAMEMAQEHVVPKTKFKT